MRAYEFLIEYTQQLVKQFGPKLIQTFREIQPESDLSDQQIFDLIIQRIEAIDPTSNNVYMLWIAKEFIRTKKWSLLTNYATISSLLKVYHDYKKHPYFIKKFGENFRNIMNLTVDDLLNVKQELLALPTEIAHAKIKLKPAYEDEQVKVYIPTTQAESCKYGANTKWCTSAEKDNKFDDYNDDGPLYIIIPKQPEYPGEKYQFHPSSREYTDETNQTIDSLSRFLHQYPGFTKWFKTQPNTENIPIFWNEEFIKNFYSQVKSDYERTIIGIAKYGNTQMKDARTESDQEFAEFYIMSAKAYTDGFPDFMSFQYMVAGAETVEQVSDKISEHVDSWFDASPITQQRDRKIPKMKLYDDKLRVTVETDIWRSVNRTFDQLTGKDQTSGP